ncbi:aminotransferase class I/II-fold pyridoxal phosphate-dependent enzyme [Yersinia alsatica]|uniref:Histidinol-phosphate aminotransferase n=3 Tax=Yersinia alsatica TaxID=2890317 RepID=A0ABY5UK59_9GAMM|nr:aminotransferase class I/II-fold pyridoxal phosphate-dependent enzyme [Yersinia alsatica]UWM43857.1 aminotransferase class I/II-fold pyridoxal phosphate-dependent enzyme [Yersinia alsatica]CNK77644.1 histidinol-phosphate aminotransferase [Yersinia frederiksenii]CNK79009.1 histidinol-phosphate aminotransferase [Yersinia frederiksenii]
MKIQNVVKKGVWETERRQLREKLAQRVNYIRLDLNENLLDLDEKYFKDFISGLKPELLSAYPDLSAIYQEMADFVGVDENEIILTNGSDLAVKCLYDACISKGDHILIHDPCYLMYERYAQFFEAELEKIPMNMAWKPDLPLMKAQLRDNTRMVILETPSGYLGTQADLQSITELAAELDKRDILLVIDEAYLYVANNKSEHLSLLKQFNNVVLLRTLSKAFGLAGARVGMVLAAPELIQQLYKVRPLYEISALAGEAAQWRLRNTDLLQEYQDNTRSNKNWLINQLNLLDIQCRDAAGNFIIVHFSDILGNNLFELLKSEGILIGKPYELSALKHWWRITVGNKQHCEILIGKLALLKFSQVNIS